MSYVNIFFEINLVYIECQGQPLSFFSGGTVVLSRSSTSWCLWYIERWALHFCWGRVEGIVRWSAQWGFWIFTNILLNPSNKRFNCIKKKCIRNIANTDVNTIFAWCPCEYWELKTYVFIAVKSCKWFQETAR